MSQRYLLCCPENDMRPCVIPECEAFGCQAQNPRQSPHPSISRERVREIAWSYCNHDGYECQSAIESALRECGVTIEE